MKDFGRKFHHLRTLTQAGFFSPIYSFGEISGGIVCGCMPTIPQFFRHFYPRIKTHFGSRTLGNNTSSGQSVVHAKQIDRARAGSKGGINHYMDLDSESHQLKTCNAFSGSTRIWSDEVSATSVGQEDQRDEARGDVSRR